MTDVPDQAGPDQAGVRFPPPLVFVGFLLAGLAIEAALGRWGYRIAPEWRILGGGALVVFGIALVALAAGRFRNVGTNPEPWKPSTAIVATGPYAITRNPMYLAMSIAYTGLAFAFDSVAALLLLPIAVLIIRTQVIAREERYLEAKFGDAYRDYKASVPRWL